MSMDTPLPVGSYCDDAVFAMEASSIIHKNWWLVGPEYLVQKNGDYLSKQIGRFPVFVIRGTDGVLRGFHNVCRHRAGPLVLDAEGHCPGKLLVCQYHGWSYDMKGGLVNAHSLNNQISKPDFSLYPVSVDIWNGLVFACVDENPLDLLTWLGDIAEIAQRFPDTSTLSAHGSIQKFGHTNWKNYGENSCEGYHVGLVHQSLKTNTEPDQINLHCFDKGRFVGFDVAYQPSELDPTRAGKGYWVYKYPGLLLHFSEFTFNAESVLPIDKDKVTLERWFWMDRAMAENQSISGEQILKSANQVMGEDLDICQRVFANLSAGRYQPIALSPKDEPGTIFFQRQVKQDYRDNNINC